MSVDLDPKTRAMIQEKVATGHYSDESEVVREAIRLMDQRERRLAQLKAELAIGKEQIERGALIDFTPELMDELCREAEENARKGKPIKDAVKPSASTSFSTGRPIENSSSRASCTADEMPQAN